MFPVWIWINLVGSKNDPSLNFNEFSNEVKMFPVRSTKDILSTFN